MAKKKENNNLKELFAAGSLPPSLMGDYLEVNVMHRGYYIKKKGKAEWAGPWRTDEAAAKADAWQYALQGYETGIRHRQTS